LSSRPTAKKTVKSRRDVTGGRRADGNERKTYVRRPDPTRIHIHGNEDKLTSVAGLVPFGKFVRGLGIDERLRAFDHLKSGPSVTYRMGTQMRMLVDAFVAGEDRVFGLESLAADPLFVRLAGGVVPSLDTVYRDLTRFDERSLASLHELAISQGLAIARGLVPDLVHIDLDTTVEPLFGSQQGALPGPNPRYPGRPSYHPFLARLAETDTIVGAVLRPGDTGVGEADVPWIEQTIDNVRSAIGEEPTIYVRIDAAGDCTAIMDAIDEKKAFFVTKAKKTSDLLGAVSMVKRWRTTDIDADGRPREQVAEVPFVRACWGDRRFRIIAVRTRERRSGEEIFLWDDIDMSVQLFITNEWAEAPEDVARRYNLRAGIEPLIGEMKHAWGIGKVPSQIFEANHAMLLLKVLAANLMRRYVTARFANLIQWRTPWLRRALILVPGRLIYRGHQWTLRVPSQSQLARLLN
jgi:hypothetical protein